MLKTLRRHLGCSLIRHCDVCVQNEGVEDKLKVTFTKRNQQPICGKIRLAAVMFTGFCWRIYLTLFSYFDSSICRLGASSAKTGCTNDRWELWHVAPTKSENWCWRKSWQSCGRSDLFQRCHFKARQSSLVLHAAVGSMFNRAVASDKQFLELFFRLSTFLAAYRGIPSQYSLVYHR